MEKKEGLSAVFAVSAMMGYTLAVTAAAIWWAAKNDASAVGVKEANVRIENVVTSTTEVVRGLDARLKALEAKAAQVGPPVAVK